MRAIQLTRAWQQNALQMSIDWNLDRIFEIVFPNSILDFYKLEEKFRNVYFEVGNKKFKVCRPVMGIR